MRVSCDESRNHEAAYKSALILQRLLQNFGRLGLQVQFIVVCLHEPLHWHLIVPSEDVHSRGHR